MPIIHDHTYLEWEQTAPPDVTKDPGWRFHTWRIARFILNRARADAALILGSRPTSGAPASLVTAAAAACVALGEALTAATRADRARVFRRAHDAVRVTAFSYAGASNVLPPALLEKRLEQLAELRRLMIAAERWLLPGFRSPASPPVRVLRTTDGRACPRQSSTST